jgi:hypothetical protein
MGEVYLAERVGGGFEQRVALKMLRPGAAARTALFESKRALLATLEHPGIARLIAGGIAGSTVKGSTGGRVGVAFRF